MYIYQISKCLCISSSEAASKFPYQSLFRHLHRDNMGTVSALKYAASR